MNFVPYEETKKQCHDVDNPTSHQYLVQKMFEFMEHNNGLGLAAPQIGIYLNIFVVNYGGLRAAFFNPTVIHTTNRTEITTEGCLTLPGELYKVKRNRSVQLLALDEKGQKINVRFPAPLSFIMQHEVDHLDGMCIKDKGERYKHR